MTMTEEEKLQEGIEKLQAIRLPNSEDWYYYAVETSEYYRIRKDELIYLSELMHHPDAEMRRDSYSHWCSGTGELLTASQT